MGSFHKDEEQMGGQVEQEEQAQHLSHLAQERLHLSASVEETLADTDSQDTSWDDEEEYAAPVSRKTSTLIPPLLTLQSKAMPAVKPAISSESSSMEKMPNVSSRLGGRSTKVRLQAVQKPAVTSATHEISTVPSIPVIKSRRVEQSLEAVEHVSPAGTGTFESGQGEVVVFNNRITASSVVHVMLTEDPGPVVVQYITLQPKFGFTVHLSAPTKTKTSFNYAILQEE